MNKRRPSVGLAVAREMTRRKAPYLSSVIYGLVPLATDSIPTMALSRSWALAYNPTYLASLSHEDACHLFWHLVQHAIDKLVRGDTGLDEARLNLAGCCVINERAISAGFVYREELLHAEDLGLPKGRSIQQNYDALFRGYPVDALNAKGGLALGRGRCWLPLDVENIVPPDLDRSEYSLAAMEHTLASDMRSWAERGKGGIPSDLLEWALIQLKPPTVPWERVLASRLRGHLSSSLRRDDNDSTYSRPHRRSFLNPADKLIYPGEAGVVADVVIILDTSGSMGGEQMAIAGREMKGVLMGLGLDEVTLIHADCAVQKVERISLQKLELGKMAAVGRGGTDFGAALQKAKELKAKAAVYITDGEGSLPAIAPPYPLIWLLVNASEGLKMPYGYSVHAK